MSNPSGSNYQQQNNVDVSNILADIINNNGITNKDLIKCFNEQLTDIKTLGTCDSGRVTRILQIWLAFPKK